MDAKRWPSLCVFIGGCLSGAALIGLQTGRGTLDVRADAAGTHAVSDLGAPVSEVSFDAERNCPDHGAGGAPAASKRHAHPGAALPAVNSAEGSEAPDKAGNSLAEVLARLEGEYRRGMAPAHAVQNERPSDGVHQQEQPAPTQPIALPVRMMEQSARAVAPATSAAPVPGTETTRGVAGVADDHSAHRLAEEPVPDEPSARSAAAPVLHAGSLSGTEEQQAAPATEQLAVLQQMAAVQQIAAAQQMAVVQQVALLQYLQLLQAPSPGSRQVPAPRRLPRVAGPPSSISDTDNPWGFDLTPSVLVR